MRSAALAIQQSHFFVVDNFSAFFAVVALLFTARIVRDGRPRDYLFAGVFVGLAVASKLSVYPLAFLPVIAAAYRAGARLARRPAATGGAAFERTRLPRDRLRGGGGARLPRLRALRLRRVSGYRRAGWPTCASRASGSRGCATRHSRHQWAGRTPLLFPLGNMIRWGLGLPARPRAWVGLGLCGVATPTPGGGGAPRPGRLDRALLRDPRHGLGHLAALLPADLSDAGAPRGVGAGPSAR